jgi:hypothetical protein
MTSTLRHGFLVFVFLLSVLTGSLDASAGIILEESHIIKPPGATGGAANPNEEDIIAAINLNDQLAYQSVTTLGSFLYKWNVGTGDETGLPLIDSYDVVGGDGSGGTITYTPPGSIVDPSKASWLVVKDGVAGWVVYDLQETGTFGVQWNGIESITFSNAGLVNPKDPNKLMDVSHIEIWGYSLSNPTPGPGVVPEPASLAICGFGALGLGLGQLRRRRNVVSTTV